jgi:hypothetical protein
MELVKYRDAGLPTFTYFWISKENRVLSPYFNSAEEAENWLLEQKKNLSDKHTGS